MVLSNKKLPKSAIFLCAFSFVAVSCAKKHVEIPRPKVIGIASWYGPGFYGRRTACGERFDPKKLTAAHRDLPFGTKVRVINTENNKSVVVTVNDRGPFRRGRIIDLTKAGAKKLGFLGRGMAEVMLEPCLEDNCGESDSQ